MDGTREKVDEEESKAIRASSAELGIESMPTNWSCECGQENVAIFTSCRKCGKVKSGTTPGNVSNASLANMDRIAVCKGEEEYEGNEDGERISEE